MVKIDIENLKEKKKKKAVTLYLNEDDYLYFKEHMKNTNLSTLVNSVLEQVAKHYKEVHEKKEKKESDKKTE